MKTQVVQTSDLIKVIYLITEGFEVVTQFSVLSEADPVGIRFNMQVVKDGKMVFFSDNPANLPRWLNES